MASWNQDLGVLGALIKYIFISHHLFCHAFILVFVPPWWSQNTLCLHLLWHSFECIIIVSLSSVSSMSLLNGSDCVSVSSLPPSLPKPNVWYTVDSQINTRRLEVYLPAVLTPRSGKGCIHCLYLFTAHLFPPTLDSAPQPATEPFLLKSPPPPGDQPRWTILVLALAWTLHTSFFELFRIVSSQYPVKNLVPLSVPLGFPEIQSQLSFLLFLDDWFIRSYNFSYGRRYWWL